MNGTASGTIPALYISGIAVAKHGAAPYGFHDHYRDDEAALARYAATANTQADFEDFIVEWLSNVHAAVAA